MVNINYFHLISNKFFHFILVLTEKEEPSSTTTMNLSSDTTTVSVILLVKIKNLFNKLFIYFLVKRISI
jgi:hypothetical protein